MSPMASDLDPSHVLPWAWQQVKDEVLSVNVADYRYWNLLAAGPRGRQQGRGCVSLPVQVMRLAVAWATLYSGAVDAVWLYRCCVLIVGLVAGFQWPGNT